MKIDIGELVNAYDMHDFEGSYYLDKQTGEILVVTDEADAIADDIYDTLGEDVSPEQITEYFAGRADIHDWQADDARVALRVSRDAERMLTVPKVETRDAYRDMEAFVATMPDRALRDRLEDAIEGRGAFGRFKRALESDDGARERWFAFKDERLRERVLEWLADEGIAIDE